MNIPHTLAVISLIGSLHCSCIFKHRKNRTTSEATSVMIAQSEVKSQGSIGLCWAYSLNGMIESWALNNKKIKVNLSEEALGFYALAENLQTLSSQPYETQEAFEQAISGATLQEGVSLSKGLDFLAKYGAIPENIWNVKFGWETSLLQTEQVKTNLKAALIDYSRKIGFKNITLENILANVMVGPNRFPSAPNATFAADGNNYSAQDYLVKYLGFDAAKFQFSTSTTENVVPQLIQAIKRALVRGFAVPISVPVFTNIRPYEAADTPQDASRFETSSAHALLVTDFVNAGGSPGGMSASELQKEVNKSPEQFLYFVVKNSYGTDWNMFEGTQDPGYASVDKPYLTASQKFGHFSAILPKDLAENIAINRDVEEPVNPLVTPPEGNDIVGDIYEKDIALGRAKNLYTGFPDGTFRPKNLITREQMIGFIVGMLKAIPNMPVDAPAVTEPPFSDVAPTRWSARLIAFAQKNNLTSGYPNGTFAPEKTVTRAEVAAMLSNAAQYAQKHLQNGKTLPDISAYKDTLFDIENHWAQKSIKQLSLFCKVTSAYNDFDSGMFHPNMGAYRNFAAAATNRLHTCLIKP